MANRIVNGNTHSENGWPLVDEAGCEWVNIPGTDVTLQLQQGQPLQIMRAFAADFHAEIEPLRDPDSAAWTSSNSVLGQPGRNNGSNHLGATGMDLNWNGPDGRTFRLGIPEAKAYPGEKAAKLRALIDWYEGNIFCGGNWDIRDWMHFQMGGDTYGNPATADFIRRKIRPDGTSTRRGPMPGGAVVVDPVVNVPPAQPADDAVTVLYDAVPVIDEDRAAELLGPLRAGLAAAQCTNPKRIAQYLAQCGWEADGFAVTEEYASGAAYEGRCSDLGNCQPGDGVRFKGRGWIMLTGRAHYANFGKWAAAQGLVTDPNYFVNNPTALAELKWAGIVSAWYWTVARPQINALCDAGDLVGVTRAINGGTNGLEDPRPGVPGRRSRYNQAIALGDRLLLLINSAPAADQGDDILSALSPDDQLEVRDNLRWLRAQFDATDFGPSSSMGTTVIDGKTLQLTVRDGLAEEKRQVAQLLLTVGQILAALTAPGVAVVQLQAPVTK